MIILFKFSFNQFTDLFYLFSFISELFPLYNKLYPANPTQLDSIILMNCEKLSWIEPKHLIKDDFNFEFFINEIIFHFNQLEKIRNPQRKFDKIISIFDIISKAILFQGFDNDKSNDKIYIDILKYIIIYIKPKRFISEIEYIQFYSFEKNNEKIKKLKILKQVCDFIKNISHKDLIDISEEEYIFNCEQSLKNHK